MVDPLKVLWVLTNSTYLVSKLFKAGNSNTEEAPYFEKALYEAVLKEDHELHTPFVTVTAHNHDQAVGVRYRLVGGGGGGQFQVEPISGAVSLAAPLDYETNKQHELRLSVTDGLSTSFTVLRVEVEDVNDNPPVFVNTTYRAQVTEEDREGLPHRILQVNVTDADVDRPMDVVYFLTGPGVDADDPSSGMFSINQTSGEVFVLKPLDRDLPHGRPQWRFTVFAQDEGGEGLVGYADILVSLRDVNDNPPVFLQSLCLANITENGTEGEVVANMTAVDYDDPGEGGNARLVYNIEQNVLDEASGRPIFAIEEDTGLVRTNVCCLDRESTADYTLQVIAVDGGGLKGTGTISISVTDINDTPPSFTKAEWVAEVSEGQVPDHPVLTVNVVDRDQSNDFYYKIIEGSGKGTEKFQMMRNPDGTGSLRVVEPLDYEDPEQRDGIRFKIQGPNSTHAAYSWVTVRVRDVNDNPPRLDKVSAEVSLSEDVPSGTLVDTFTASDPDLGDSGRVTFRVVKVSDPHRHFRVDNGGHVTVLRPLDRETTPVHKVLIEATDGGEPALSSTATLTVNVLDVNDNPPSWLQDYRPVITENTVPGLVLEARAVDGDDHVKGNGPPYTFYLDTTNNTLGDLFSVDTNPKGDSDRGVAVVSSLVSFDRETQAVFYLPVVIEDSGDPVMSGTSTLTVTIGDLNDNPMAPGASHILVYKLTDSTQAMYVGRVYASDPDDWDTPDKTFYWDSAPDPHFALDRASGGLRLTPDTGPGQYWMRFRVRDSRHSLSTVLCNVTVTVRDLTWGQVERSVVITLAGIKDVDFIKSGKTDVFREAVGRALDTPQQHVHVISVSTAQQFPPRTDVRFFVEDDSRYHRPYSVIGALLQQRQSVEEAVSARVLAAGPSQCLDDGEGVCEPEGGCSERLSLSPGGSHVVHANTSSLAGPGVEVTVRCECPARDYLTPETCHNHHCLHGGICTDTQLGPRCECREQYDGPRCQQSVRGFPPGPGWVWYPPLEACSAPHLTLELHTTSPDGLLLYNGPLAPPIPGVRLHTDFISLELEGGTPRLLLDLGSGTVELTLPTRLDDGEWHRLDVLWDLKEVRLMTDRCRPRNVTDLHDRDVAGGGSADCLTRAALPPFSGQLNVNTPLQLGGWSVTGLEPREYGWGRAPRGVTFTGCLRNLFFNDQLVDLAEPQGPRLTLPGCPQASAPCGVPCAPHGHCQAARCRCHPGYTGPSCSTPTVPSTFLPGGYVKYSLAFEPDRHSTDLQLRFRTREPRGEIIRLTDQHRREYLILEITEKHLQLRMNTNSYRPKEQTVRLTHVTVDDGQWHDAMVSRQGSLVELRLDGGEGRRYNDSFLLRGHQLLTVDKQEGVVAGASFSQGCLDDIRLDGKPLPLPPALNGTQWAQATAVGHVDRHCHSRNVCAEVKCPQTFLCHDLWNDYVCSCGGGKVATEDGRACADRNECLHRPCQHGGLCYPRDTLLGYRCVCPDGYWGQRCETVQGQSVRVGVGALCTIVGCIMLVLVLVALLMSYNRRREAVPVKKAGHDDDVRENIISYNDDGSGQDDLNAFDLLPLNVTGKGRKHKALQVPEVIGSTSLGERLATRRRHADLDQGAPGDDLRNFVFEGSCDSVVGSLSSLDSCSDSTDVRYVVLGPRFARLLNIYNSSSATVYHQEEPLEATV